LLPEESSDKYEIFVITVAKWYTKQYFVFPTKYYFHYNCAYCQKATDEKDGYGDRPMSNFMKNIKVHEK
jgi:hypothetical protein